MRELHPRTHGRGGGKRTHAQGGVKHAQGGGKQTHEHTRKEGGGGTHVRMDERRDTRKEG